MDYHISRTKNGATDGVETWQGSPLEAVKEHAREVVDLGLADRVEVRDASQTLVFHYPRVLRLA